VVNGKALAGAFVLVMFVMAMVSVSGCTVGTTSSNPITQVDNTPKTLGGVSQAQASVYTNADGLTVDQAAVKKREEFEADPNKLKYIIIFNWNGNELYTGLVDGKVHSSGRSLSPRTVAAGQGYYVSGGDYTSGHAYSYGIPVTIDGKEYVTSEVMADDGTYGSGGTQYIYWWDQNGIYHQQSVGGGIDYHLSGQPMHMKDGKIAFEAAQ
jgi:hypothetical protein